MKQKEFPRNKNIQFYFCVFITLDIFEKRVDSNHRLKQYCEKSNYLSQRCIQIN